MKSEKNPKPTNPRSKFPVLMEFRDGEFVVLFSSEKKGVVVYSEYKPYPVGYFDEAWKDCYSGDWCPYKGSISLYND